MKSKNEALNVKTYRLRISPHHLQTDQGLRVVRVDNRRFIDPRNTSRDNSKAPVFAAPPDPNHLKVELSGKKPLLYSRFRAVSEASIAASALNRLDHIRSYRLRRAERRKNAGRVALVGVITSEAVDILPKADSTEPVKMVDSFRVGQRADDPYANLIFLRDGETVVVRPHQLPEGSVEEVHVTHKSDYLGLITERKRTLPEPPLPPDIGVREPWGPAGSGPDSAAATLEQPETELAGAIEFSGYYTAR